MEENAPKEISTLRRQLPRRTHLVGGGVSADADVDGVIWKDSLEEFADWARWLRESRS